MSVRSIISGSSLRTRSGRSQQNETFITLIAQSVINSTYSFTHVPFAKHVYHIVTTQAQINTCQLWRLVLEYRSLKIIREKMKQSSDLTKRQLPKRSTVISTLLIDYSAHSASQIHISTRVTVNFLIQIPHSVLLQFVPAVFNSSCLVRASILCLFAQLCDIVNVNHLCDSTIGVDKVGRPSLVVICGFRGRLVFGLCWCLSL
ncbi:Hypothetical_protein [Hexamita inflata]|uniref:Hypothetical_protein n=1 Tax=Hexamita inflata TaxID=28002 RepID=A0AA86RA03_9EUKA|nr:Hypothetical protein HINF_LOCUS62224 [Hexamita inflata]